MKEKRILCIEVSGECKNFADIDTPLLADAFECQQGLYCTKNTAWKPITKDACKNCHKANYVGITREQAIEKISHALCTKVHGACETCEQVAGGNENHCNDYRTYAEAVLNALLEENNEGR